MQTKHSRKRYSKAYVDDTRYTHPYVVYNPLYEDACKDGCKLPKKDEYNLWSRDPRMWGPHLWSYMHYAAANYPDEPSSEDIHKMMAWLYTLSVTIPCESCKIHYAKHIEKNKHNLHKICSSRDSLFGFLVDTHNKVNKRNNKPTLTYQQAEYIFGDHSTH